MAQRSKKDQISEAALPILLEQGIKGTSIDMVVKTSAVSKPTVYNHFPDKATLIQHVIERWLSEQAEPAIRARTVNGLLKEIRASWFNNTALRLYGLFIGEGFRAESAATIFQKQYDDAWRGVLADWCEEFNQELSATQAAVSDLFVSLLLSPKRS